MEEWEDLVEWELLEVSQDHSRCQVLLVQEQVLKAQLVPQVQLVLNSQTHSLVLVEWVHMVEWE